MEVPIAARIVAAVLGGGLVLAVWASVIGTLIVPRPVASWLTRWVDRVALLAYPARRFRVPDARGPGDGLQAA